MKTALPMIIWFVMAGVVLLSAVAVVLGAGRKGYLGIVLGVTGLLIMLGIDLAALAWLGAGTVLVRLVAGMVPGMPPSEARTPTTWRTRMLRMAVGFPALVFGVLLVVLVWTVDWHAVQPSPPSATAALVGGRLLTADLVLWLGVGLVLMTVLMGAGWLLFGSRSDRDKEGA